MMNPVNKPSQKLKILNSAFKDRFHPVVNSFIALVIKNKREVFLSSISRVFVDIFKKDTGIKSATLTTSKAIDEELRNKITKYITKKLDIKVELSEKLNDKIIGGFILRIEDHQIDASVLTQLNQIRKELLTT
jgi:F-type H+-transporting ATPase subunit delta